MSAEVSMPSPAEVSPVTTPIGGVEAPQLLAVDTAQQTALDYLNPASAAESTALVETQQKRKGLARRLGGSMLAGVLTAPRRRMIRFDAEGARSLDASAQRHLRKAEAATDPSKVAKHEAKALKLGARSDEIKTNIVASVAKVKATRARFQ